MRLARLQCEGTGAPLGIDWRSVFRAALRNVLLYHVAAGRYPAKRVVKQTSIETLAGPRVKVTTRKGTVRVGGARVVQADVRTSNGVIHAINRVLIPPQ